MSFLFAVAAGPPAGVVIQSMTIGGLVRNSFRARRGFSLVELMTAVLIIGVLGAIAGAAFKRYLTQARTAEARRNLRAIANGVLSAGQRQVEDASIIDLASASSGKTKGKGKSSADEVSRLCGSAEPVPASFTMVQQVVYQSRPSEWRTGDQNHGWTCLRFGVNSPQYFQYGYDRGGSKTKVTMQTGSLPSGVDREQTWVGWARADLDGDSRVSWISIQGMEVEGELTIAPNLSMRDVGE